MITLRVKAAIQRMTTAHGMAMSGVGDWQFAAANTDTGVILAVKTPAKDAAKLHALGFIGVMTRGMHHQQHHLMITRGDDPHH